MGRQPRLHSPRQWSYTKQTQNKTHLYQMASFFRWNTEMQHKYKKNPHIIKHIRHTDKTGGYIKIHRFVQIPHGMVKSLLRFACGGVFTGLTRNPKGVSNDPSCTQSQYWVLTDGNASARESVMLIGRYPGNNGRPTKSARRTAVQTQTWRTRTCDIHMSVTLSYSCPGSG
jgi:hypothetical protein